MLDEQNFPEQGSILGQAEWQKFSSRSKIFSNDTQWTFSVGFGLVSPNVDALKGFHLVLLVRVWTRSSPGQDVDNVFQARRLFKSLDIDDSGAAWRTEVSVMRYALV